MSMKIGLIGAGAIAKFLLKKVNQNNSSDMQIVSVFVRDREKYQFLESEFHVKLYTDFDKFLASTIDIVVEAANISAVKSMLPKVIQAKDTIIISIGALVDEEFLQYVTELAQSHDH